LNYEGDFFDLEPTFYPLRRPTVSLKSEPQLYVRAKP